MPPMQRKSELNPGDDGNDAGQGEQAGEDLVGHPEGGEAEGHS